MTAKDAPQVLKTFLCKKLIEYFRVSEKKPTICPFDNEVSEKKIVIFNSSVEILKSNFTTQWPEEI